MRVVSGKCKGRQLKSVPGKQTRPTTDKVKEALFNMIGPYFDGGIGLDLFAGSGALGIEGLSRGLDKVIFVERDYKAYQTIKTNVANCDFTDQAEIYRTVAEKALRAIKNRSLNFNYIFLDPPYKKHELERLLETINRDNLLLKNGLIVCEHDSQIKLPCKVGSLIQKRHEQYGLTAITIYSKQ